MSQKNYSNSLQSANVKKTLIANEKCVNDNNNDDI